MRNICVESVKQLPIENQDIEIVERKGIGHPDSISDGIAESVSRALCKAYLERFGAIMHHNTDEVQVIAGESSPKFGGGEVIKPIHILLAGRGVAEVKGEKIGLNRISIAAAKEYLKENIRNLDVETSVVIECKIGHGSAELQEVFERKKDKIPLANDTSFGVGFAPLSETEKIVLESEKLLNSDKFKKKYPMIGEDIKVMGLREKDKITLTLACAMVDKYIDDLDTYKEAKAVIKETLRKLVSKHTERDVDIYVNTADRYDEKEPSIYLTVTGTSAEMGDDGSTGRGNRANGLITPNRPMSLEACSGKNPVNHVGKIYNLLSNEIAEKIVNEVDSVLEAQILLLSQIGKPIDNPKVADCRVILEEGCKLSEVKSDIEAIIDDSLENIQKITEKLIDGKITTF